MKGRSSAALSLALAHRSASLDIAALPRLVVRILRVLQGPAS